MLHDAREKFVVGWSCMRVFLSPFGGFGCVGSGAELGVWGLGISADLIWG